MSTQDFEKVREHIHGDRSIPARDALAALARIEEDKREWEDGYVDRAAEVAKLRADRQALAERVRRECMDRLAWYVVEIRDLDLAPLLEVPK
jgi:hypothetical protein